VKATTKPREGSLLRISLGDGTDAFARVLPNSQVAVYAHRLAQSDATPPGVFESKILWKLTVMKSALTSGGWRVVDFRPLEAELSSPVEYFIRDRLTGQYSKYRSSDGQTRESTFEECKGLEAAAAWDAKHVEDRLRDYFADRPNAWAEQLKAIP
jgi:hypothetical protein